MKVTSSAKLFSIKIIEKKIKYFLEQTVFMLHHMKLLPFTDAVPHQ